MRTCRDAERFEYIDHPCHHGDDPYPLAHNPVTSHFVSGPVRFPVDLRLFRRYEDVTPWETFVHNDFPDQEIPQRKKERTQFHKVADPVLQHDLAFRALEQACHTQIELAIELVEAAMGHQLPFSVVWFDSWYLAPDFIAVLRRRRTDWVSILKKNRNLETHGFGLTDTSAKRIPLDGPPIGVEDLVPLIPPTAYRRVKVGDTTD